MVELTDDQARARIESMTMQEREALVAQCERLWRGTPWEGNAKLLRQALNAMKHSLN